MGIFLSLLLSLLAAYFLLKPLYLNANPERSSEYLANQALLEKRNRYVQLLKDLELDFSTGKIADQDYQQMKNSLMLEFAELLGQIEKQGSVNDQPAQLQS